MNNIIINNISKSYGSKIVLSGFSEVIPPRGTTVIMGESGCGKTTLINIILGLEKADSGEISGLPEHISAVFQDDLLFEDFSAISNVKSVCPKLPKSKIADALLSLGLTKKDVNCPMRELSGGMKRRVAIVRAILSGGDLIIMDEPFKGLDHDTRRTVIDFVLQETQGKSLIVISHSPEEAELLNAGKIIQMK